MWFTSFPRHSVTSLRDAYDYIIVGGGTAGCVLANRLSEDPSVSVLVIERGGVDDGWISKVPFFSLQFVFGGRSTRIYKSTPQEHMNGRVFEMAGGHSLGGASKVNAMLYTRGVAGEYNAWSQAGRQGWSYGDLQPYFIKSETDLDQNQENPQSYHGTSGEWCNRSHGNFWGHTAPIIEACQTLGLPYVDDLNSPLHPTHGCAKMHFAIDAKGHRSSTLAAFLPRDLMHTRNQRLHVCTNAIVSKVNIERDEDEELVARGVYVQTFDQRSSSRFVRARKEVILSAGPVGSPHILMLSGIGPGLHLKEHGIPVVKDLPGVGSHLQDHVGIAAQYRVPLKDSIAKLQVSIWAILKELFMYLFFGMGLLLAPVLELSIFVQTRLFDPACRTVTPTPEDEDAALPMNLPDIEVMPIAWSDAAASRSKGDGGLGFLVVNLRPSSTGTVRLSSADPYDDPAIDLNYFATEHDRIIMRQGVRFTHRLAEQIVAQKYPMTQYLVPASESDEDIDTFIRERSQTTFHYSSTCRMAPEVPGSSVGGVVDDRLCVHGIRGLRVADSSIFPNILSTHLAAATVAVAEKCADMIKEDNAGTAVESK